jgi:hypothetical protein
MPQNFISTAGGTNFAAWTPTVLGAATAPLGTYGATSGPDSFGGLTLSSTGTAGGIEVVASLGVEQENLLGLSLIAKASSATPTFVPFAVSFTDAAGNAILTVTPIASAAAPVAFTAYSAVVGVPHGAVKASFAYAALSWASVGGYTVILATPLVNGF